MDAQGDRLVRLQAVTDAALAHLALDGLLDELLARVRDLVVADTAAVLLLDESGERLVARAAKGLEEAVERGVTIPVGPPRSPSSTRASSRRNTPHVKQRSAARPPRSRSSTSPTA